MLKYVYVFWGVWRVLSWFVRFPCSYVTKPSYDKRCVIRTALTYVNMKVMHLPVSCYRSSGCFMIDHTLMLHLPKNWRRYLEIQTTKCYKLDPLLLQPKFFWYSEDKVLVNYQTAFTIKDLIFRFSPKIYIWMINM